MGKGASQVSLTETSLELRTDASLEEPVEIRVVQFHSSRSVIRFFGVEAFRSLANLEDGFIALFDWRLLYKSSWLLLREEGAWDLNGSHLAALRRIGGFIFRIRTNTVLLLRQASILLLTHLIIYISSGSIALIITRSTATLPLTLLRATRAIRNLIAMMRFLRRGIMGFIDGVGGVVIFKKETGKRTVLLGLLLMGGIGNLTKFKVIGTIEGNGVHRDD